ncbi:hypothetical protein Rhe02_25490 [Rhizocola hellebori]|uniref:DUF3515 domain-containing protein n=1 Tax=Rhizocola hellebori TaxID=1392758 RepID=A0A8J3VFV5_9ACTN|nr:hypothetical protein Rhe02_25490 [Rhizocola hellebori]
MVAGFVMFQTLKPAPAPTPTAQATASASVAPVPTAPVPVAAIALSEREAVVCRAFLAKLPEQLRGLPRRQVTGGHEQNAAFGDPAVTLTCGGPAPTFAPTDFVYPLSGVCWHPNEAGSVWTTVDREVTIALALPGALSGEGSGQWAAALSGPVTAAVPSAQVKPSGCG